APETLRRGLLHEARRHRGHDGVPEDHVAMQVVAAGLAAPLVGDEGGERAGGGPIVELFGRRLRVLPDERRFAETVRVVRAAPGEALRRDDGAVAEQEGDDGGRWQLVR